MIFKHNPLGFHPRAMPAAIASECAGEQGKFWEFHDKLFENQQQLSDDDFVRYANDVGLNASIWKSCVSSRKPEQRILKQQQEMVGFGARGTPAFYINGRFLSGAQPFEQFKTLIDEELEKAKKSGIDRADYYRKTVVEKGEKNL